MPKHSKAFILQFITKGHNPLEDFDALIAIEEELDNALSQNCCRGYVDGHDIDGGIMNIYIFFPSWKNGEEFLLLYLRHRSWSSQVVVAERRSDTQYKIIWPADHVGAFSL